MSLCDCDCMLLHQTRLFNHDCTAWYKAMKTYKYTRTFMYNGKRYYIRGNTLDEVYQKKAQKLHALKHGLVTYNGDMLFRVWTEIAVDTYKSGTKDETRQNIICRMNSCVFPEIGDYPIKSIKPLQLQKIMNQQAGKSKSHCTKLRSDLLFIFRKAVDNKMIIDNPASCLELPDYYDNHRRSLTDYERRHVEKVCEADDRFVLFLLMLYCGCRPSEAMEAKGFDIQQMDGINVLHIRGTKTANSDRFVPVPNKLYSRICNTPKFANIAVSTAGKPFNKTSYKRLTARFKRELNLSMGCKTYRNKLIPPYPLDASFVPYFLRHTYCTDLATKGIDIRVAQKLMGHSDIKMTANIYTHVQNDHIIQAAKLINS